MFERKHLKKYITAMGKGVNWLKAHQNEDGAIEPIGQGLGAYQKTGWAFIRTGKVEEANKLFSWIKKNRFTSEGDFANRTPGYVDELYPYPNSWLISAAHQIGRFDISYPAMKFILTLQNPEIGGFYRVEGGPTTGGEMDVLCTSACGISALYLGEISAAENVFNFLNKVWQEQPRPAEIFYCVYDSEEGLVTNLQEANKTLGPIYYGIKRDEGGQNYYNLGIAASFLIRFYLSTGDKNALKLAKKFINYGLDCTGIYESPRACKFGWGTALLYKVTQEEKFKEAAVRVWDFITELQKRDGHWESPVEAEKSYVSMDWTSEFVYELSEVILGLT